MVLAEALAVLGIEHDVDAKGARRAYLQLIKRHKPEQDAEGFRRAREAWECVQRYLDDVQDADDWKRPLAGPADDSRSRNEVNVPLPPLDSVVTEPTRTEPVEEPSPVDSVVTESTRTEPVEEPSPVELWLLTLQAGEIDAAAAQLQLALALPPEEAERVSLPGEAVLATLGQLARQNPQRFISVFNTYDKWLQTQPATHDALSGSGAVRWGLLKELMGVRTRLSAGTFFVLAALLATNDGALTVELIRRREQDPGRASVDRDVLLAYAPKIAGMFGDYLVTVSDAEARRQTGSSLKWWPLLLGSFIVLRLISSVSTCDGSRRNPTFDRQAVLANAREAVQAMREAVPTPPGEIDRGTVDEAMARLGNQLGKSSTEYDLASNVAHSLTYGTCGQAGTDLGALDVALAGAGVDQRDEVQVLWGEFAVKCPGLLPEYQP